MELNDAAWDQPPLQNDFNYKPGDKFTPFTESTNAMSGFNAAEPTTQAIPGMEPRRDACRQTDLLCESHSNSLTEEANERVMSAAVQCLSMNEDMEQAYVCILSTINVLQRGGRLQGFSSECARKLLKIMTLPKIAERLGNEIERQGVFAPGALYYQIYQAIQDAGYPLEEAEVLLDRYLSHSRTLLLLAQGAASKLDKVHQERERASRVMIQKWFRLQLDASKWEETKAQYECRRARLMEAPANIDRFLSSLSFSEVENKPEQGEETFQTRQLIPHGEGCTTLPSSTTTVPASSRLKGVSTTTANISSRPDEVAKEVQTKGRFSFLSAFKSTPSAKTKESTTTASLNIDTKKPNSAKSPSHLTPLQTHIGSSSIHVNRHLTVLDNGMLEECINHKQFEYGWKHVYERMGPARLEDKDTAKIAMRLCKRAFLGHGGLNPHLKGGSSSPNLLAKELCFEDDRLSQGSEGQKAACGPEGTHDAEHGDRTVTKRDGGIAGGCSGAPSWKNNCEEDAEVWEARAWAIYNKAMMNPFFFSSSGNTPAGSPTQPQQPTATTIAQGTGAGSGTTRGGGGGVLTLSSPISGMAGTTSLAVFLHNILTVAIHSPEHSSRFMKAFKVYCAMRNDPLNRYQAQLRDPFVMTCMFKAIYDTVLAIIKAQSTEQHRMPHITIGPLMDLAFEIYADMRNVGPIRHLPRLSALTPLTPLPRTPKTPGFVHSSSSLSESNSSHSLGGSMSMFFNLSNRPSSSSSLTTVDLSAYGSTNTATAASPTTTTATSSRGEKNASSVAPTVQVVLQDLNPTLEPNPQARRLPNELYLALLHLCIQVPLSGLSTSFKVVKTIVSDMMSTLAGQQPANLDSHLAAALQFYHDRWMCRPQELEERTPSCCLTHGEESSCENCADHNVRKRGGRDSATHDEDEDGDEAEDDRCGRAPKGCIYHGWMYQPESYILKHTSPSNVSSTNSSLSDLCDTHFTTESSTITTTSSSSSSSSLTTTTTTTTAAAVAKASVLSTSNRIDVEPSLTENENSQYGIFKHDADLDELDQYLNARMQPIEKGMQDPKRPSDWGLMNEHSARVHWIDGLEHDTCNDRFYWDLWSRQDPILQSVRFSRRRARMLWRHIGSMDM
ncbi:hypothetical protein EC968_010270 [Mortierella alpina]|nr:hypothetical protein EC968_010270 [Mortierella alpina]